MPFMEVCDFDEKSLVGEDEALMKSFLETLCLCHLQDLVGSPMSNWVDKVQPRGKSLEIKDLVVSAY